jgi:hypothetical protein
LLPKSVQLYANLLKAAAFVAAVKTRSNADTAQGAIQIIQEKLPWDANRNISSKSLFLTMKV